MHWWQNGQFFFIWFLKTNLEGPPVLHLSTGCENYVKIKIVNLVISDSLSTFKKSQSRNKRRKIQLRQAINYGDNLIAVSYTDSHFLLHCLPLSLKFSKVNKTNKFLWYFFQQGFVFTGFIFCAWMKNLRTLEPRKI